MIEYNDKSESSFKKTNKVGWRAEIVLQANHTFCFQF